MPFSIWSAARNRRFQFFFGSFAARRTQKEIESGDSSPHSKSCIPPSPSGQKRRCGDASPKLPFPCECPKWYHLARSEPYDALGRSKEAAHVCAGIRAPFFKD